jgi:hypothetical protein
MLYTPYFGESDHTGVDGAAFYKLPSEIEFEISGEAEECLVWYIINRHGGIEGKKVIKLLLLTNIINLLLLILILK